MRCYLESKPKRRGYRKRVLTFWAEKDVFKVNEQRLVDYINAIRLRKWMIQLREEEITKELKEINQVIRKTNNARDTPQANEESKSKDNNCVTIKEEITGTSDVNYLSKGNQILDELQ